MPKLPGVLCLLLLPAGRLAAQYPGQTVEPGWERVRSQYVSQMFQEILPVLEAWRSRLELGDVKGLTDLMEPEMLFSPATGWLAWDRREAAESLTVRREVIRGYFASPLDFTASGNLAYLFGRVAYSAAREGAPPREVRGSFTMVLFLRGSRWKVRAYLERAGE